MKREKINRPPAGEQFIWMTRSMLCSDAWRSLGINAQRVIHFLIIEHLRKGGRHNGELKAPHRQLIEFGVCNRTVATAIREAEELGFIDCNRGGMRVATAYGLTWLPAHDGAQASNRWRGYRNPDLPPLPQPKSRNLPEKSKAGLHYKSKADAPYLPEKSNADRPQNLPYKSNALSRESLTKAGKTIGSLGAGAEAPVNGASGTIVDLPVGVRR